jgi:hypothetical protein
MRVVTLYPVPTRHSGKDSLRWNMVLETTQGCRVGGCVLVRSRPEVIDGPFVEVHYKRETRLGHALYANTNGERLAILAAINAAGRGYAIRRAEFIGHPQWRR